jgi:hypothetical protein
MFGFAMKIASAQDRPLPVWIHGYGGQQHGADEQRLSMGELYRRFFPKAIPEGAY